MINTHKINEKLTWFEVVDPTKEEKDQLISQGWTPELLVYALDPNESARTEYDKVNGTTLLVFDILTPDSDDETEPVALFFDNEGNLCTVARNTTARIGDQLFMETSQNTDSKIATAMDVFLNGAYSSMVDYIEAVKNINRQRNVVQKNLISRLKTTDITSLMQLQIKVTYMVDSLKANQAAIKSLRNIYATTLTSRQQEMFDDLLVENDQAIDMSTQAADVITLISKSYSSIHNQKLDSTLRILTVVQAVMAVPTVITGFYGMNMELPLQELPIAWLLVIIASITIVALELYLLFKSHYFDN